jgi:hypothetical protein
MTMGNYRNEIKDLTSLDVIDYERIFKIFEKLSDEDKVYYIYNINKTIKFPVISPEFLGKFTPTTRLALTIVSYKIYGDISI